MKKKYNSVIRKLDYKIKKKDYDKYLNGSIKLNLDKNVILNSFNLFIKKADDLKREERQFEKARLKELKYYQSNSLIESINDILTLDEITNASDIVKSIKNEEIKKAVLTLIYEHNMKYYKNLKKEYLKLAKNDKSKYIALLNDYDLPTDEKFIEKIRYISIEEMKNILKIIFKYNLNKITLIQILTNNTALVNVLEINEYYELGIIDLKFIKQNLDILEKDSEKFRILSDNIKLIRNYTINPVLLKNNSTLFFESSELLKNNLDILSTYNLIKAFKTTADFAFLTSSNLNVKIDKMLELGFESFLEKDLSVLKSDNIKRLSLVKPLFIEFTSINDLKEFLEDEFYVKDELIDNYVESFYNYKEKKEYGVNIEILEDFKYTRRTYNINGVIISKNKVEKLVSEGFDLYDALFKNMNISEDEYNLVVCELDKKVFQKKYV